jgi:glycylpeptide N-tetradecanoyltransferase
MSSESKPNAKARVQDIIEETLEASASSDSDGPEPAASSSTPTSASSSKKKKKKKTKALKALLKGDKEIPQALVDEVLQRAQQNPSASGETVDEETVRKTMEQLKIMDVLKGKSGLGGKNKKEMGEHKVNTILPRRLRD